MDNKVKYAIVGGGALLILAVGLIGKKGGGSEALRRQEISAGVDVALSQSMAETNRAAFSYMGVVAKNNADIVINRDQVNGATALRTIESLDNIVSVRAQQSVMNAQAFAGVQTAKIYSTTQYQIAAVQASAAKYIAKQERKAAKYAGNASKFGQVFDFLGTAAKSAPAIIGAL